MTKQDREALKETIRQMIREELANMIDHKPDLGELPPLPEKETGQHGRPAGQGQRVKIGGTCDKALWNELDDYRKRHGMSLSRAIDTALWHFLGKPPLSFQSRSQ